MKRYEKPIITIDTTVAEGVYAASGSSGSGCYEVTTNIHQKPEEGRGDYRIQVNGVHKADHTKEAQTLTLVFNQSNVEYSSSSGTLASQTGNTISINYTYHQNPSDNIGLGDVVVIAEANPELVITSATITD